MLVNTQESITQNIAATTTLTTQLDRMDKTQDRLLREMLRRPCLLDVDMQRNVHGDGHVGAAASPDE